MATNTAEALRGRLKAGTELAYLDELAAKDLALLDRELRAACQREQSALDAAIEKSMSMVPLLLRGAFKRILFP